MQSLINYKKKVVAFIDILGFRELTLQLSRNARLRAKIHQVLTRIKSVESLKVYPLRSLEVSVFSDSIVISSELKDIESLLWSVGLLQSDLLRLGVLVRGGIAIGKTFHQGGIIYGEGMISAYDLEQKARFPRIVLSEELFETIETTKLINWLILDEFEMSHVDPFQFIKTAGSMEDFEAEGYPSEHEYFREVGKQIAQQLKRVKEFRHSEKWKWMAEEFNEAAHLFNQRNPEQVELIRI